MLRKRAVMSLVLHGLDSSKYLVRVFTGQMFGSSGYVWMVTSSHLFPVFECLAGTLKEKVILSSVMPMRSVLMLYSSIPLGMATRLSRVAVFLVRRAVLVLLLSMFLRVSKTVSTSQMVVYLGRDGRILPMPFMSLHISGSEPIGFPLCDRCSADIADRCVPMLECRRPLSNRWAR